MLTSSGSGINFLNNMAMAIPPCFGIRLTPTLLVPNPSVVSGQPPIGATLTAQCADGSYAAENIPCHEAVEVYANGLSPIVRATIRMEWPAPIGLWPANFAMYFESETMPGVRIPRGVHTPDANGFPFLGAVALASGMPLPAFASYGVIAAMQLATVAGAGAQWAIPPLNHYHVTIQNLGADPILVYPSPALSVPTDANSFRIASNQVWDDEIGNGWGLSLAVVPGGATPQVAPADTRVRMYG